MSDLEFPSREESPEDTRQFVAWFLKHQEDGLWALSNPEILDRYPGHVVVLHERKVIGSGRDDLEALHDAEQQARVAGTELPPRHLLLFLPISEHPYLDEEFLPPRCRSVLPITTDGPEQRTA